MKHIASADNPQYKALLKLAQNARARAKQGSALLDGVHLVEAALQHGIALQSVAVSVNGLENKEIRTLLGKIKTPALVLSNALFKKLSTVETPTGMIAVIAKPALSSASAYKTPAILLEDIQDAGNLGSILRSAAAAGVWEVFLSKHSVDAWSPRVLRAAQGAHFALTIYEDSDLPAVARNFKGKVVATRLDAEQSLYHASNNAGSPASLPLRGTVAFAFGNEGAGLSAALSAEIAKAGVLMKIPMAPGVESLNVAAAAAVCLFEWRRQNVIE